MRKIVFILFLTTSFFSAAQAQKKFVYEDSSLLQQEEVYAPVEEAPVDTATHAADEATTDEVEPPDTSLYLNNLYLPVDSIRKWKQLKEYAYINNLDSLLKAEMAKKKKPKDSANLNWLMRLLSSDLLQITLWILGIGFILFIIHRLFLADGTFLRRSRSVKNELAEVKEEIIDSDSDFDRLISQALQQQNFRQAVRYQYLRTLHALADRNFIELAPDKTNFQYVREISNSDHQQDFAALTLHYEYVWYGEFNIEKNIYQKIEGGFIRLNQKL